MEKKDELLFFTTDGVPYRLKVATKTVDATLVGTLDVLLFVEYNFPDNVALEQWQKISLDTSQPILPLLYNMGAIDLGNNTSQADIGSPFYGYFTNGQSNYAHLPGISKALAQAVLNDYSTERFYHYGLRYDRINLSSKDFLAGNVASRIQFLPYQAFAMANSGANLGLYDLQLPPGDYRFGITFVYFELQS